MQQSTIREALARRDGDRPLHQEIALRLADLIRRGDLTAGERLPSERQLTDLGGVSRVTVRKALTHLSQQGLIEQRHGSGSYVRAQAASTSRAMLPVTSLSEELRRRGQLSRTIWLTRQMAMSRFRDMTVLNLPRPERIAQLERLRLVDERPLSFERSVFREHALPDVSAIEQSVYEVLKANDALPVRVVQDVTAVNMAPREAARLDCLPAAAGLKVTRTGYDRAGSVIEFTEALFRPDAYRMVMEFGIATGP